MGSQDARRRPATAPWISTLVLAAAVCLTVPSSATAAQTADPAPRAAHGRTLDAPAVSDRPFVEVRRYDAPEASQGVAVDSEFFYAVGNRRIAKYERETGAKVREWRGEADGPVIHLNSCVVIEASLICAHSNHPGVPMLSSIEIWNTATLEHTESISFGIYEGSLTWAIPQDGSWWLNFAHYGNESGTPGKGSEWTSLIQFDANWHRQAGYAYPVELIEQLTPNSLSGGNWSADGRLYVTGHDEAEIYVLELPAMGSVLRWVETIPAPMHGQAWVFDPKDDATVWGLVRSARQVVVGRRR